MPIQPHPNDLRDLYIKLNPNGWCDEDLEKDSLGFVDLHTSQDFNSFRAGHQAGQEDNERITAERDALQRLLNERDEEVDRLRTELVDAIQSLKTISELAGRDQFMQDMADVRGYAKSRSSVADYILSASAKPSAPSDCAICRDLGNQCMECEEGEFREWADRHFAAADYRKTDAGVFIQDWMRHAYGAWCARGALGRKP